MIITRSPLRITLGGGGTDLPSYYSDYSGFLIAAAIDKYVYITIHQNFSPGLIIKYSKMERVAHIHKIRHPIIRKALEISKLENNDIEITSMADIPAGTGLGSSSSFTTALLKALHTANKELITSQELAELACKIEIDLLKEPIGKQDQYIAAYGGVMCFRFHSNGKVEVSPLKVSQETLYNLEENLVLFYTGVTRSASSILKDQDKKSRQNNRVMLENLHVVKELAKRTHTALEKDDLRAFAGIMNEHWEYKKKRSVGISNETINQWYDLAMKNGALGGKLIGAGGGGFLMFYSENKVKLRRAMAKAGLSEVHFRFDHEGTKVIIQS